MDVKNTQSGFTLIEVLLAIVIFSFGILALASMQMTSLQGDDRANIGSEATTIAGDKLEELMTMAYADPALLDTDGDGTNQDTAPDDGVDDNGGNFGLQDVVRPDVGGGAAVTADYFEIPTGTQGNYTVLWNVAVDEPVQNSKRITIIVQWLGQDAQNHQVVLNTVKPQLNE
jgi:prepilin-type N-terminal cleavage/methylation domain-containing protein